MTEHIVSRFPHNKPYIDSAHNHSSASPRPSRAYQTNQHSPNSRSVMTASLLHERVQDLEDQLIHLANALNQQGRQNQGWQEQSAAQNRKLRALLNHREQQVATLTERMKESEEEVKLLKDGLFKQNEEMEVLHKQLQEARFQNSRGKRTNSPQLQQKIQQLNDEVSTLLVKIQQLIQENNQQQTYTEDLQRAIKEFKSTQEPSTDIQTLTDENRYLKEQIKQVEALAISQQNQLLQQLDEVRLELQHIQQGFQYKGNQLGSNAKQSQVNFNTSQKEKQISTLRSEIHTLQSDLLQQRQLEKSLKRKYDQKLSFAQSQAQHLNEEISKLKHKIRQLESSCSDHTFALSQLQKQKDRAASARSMSNDNDYYKNIIVRLEAEKEELNSKLNKFQPFKQFQKPQQCNHIAIHQAQAKISLLREQLSFAEQQLIRSRRSSRQITEMAKRWEQDYRLLSQEYECALKTRGNVQQRGRIEETELYKHKEIYGKLVSKCDYFEGMYKELQTKVYHLQKQNHQKQKEKPNSYDKESADLIRLENSALKQQISQLNARIEELYAALSTRGDKSDQQINIQIERYKSRQKELQRLLDNMRNRLANESNHSNQNTLMNQGQLKQQLQRVNRMLNQREMELESLKGRYDDLHNLLNRKDDTANLPKHHPQLTRLKADYVALQRKMMETQLAAKNSLQNAEYEMQALKLQNFHHRKKIDELLKEITQEKNGFDSSTLMRLLQLREVKSKDMENKQGQGLKSLF